MRSAKLAEMWSALEKNPKREPHLSRFNFRNFPGLCDGSIVFKSPITAICGVNGTGKSSILRALWCTLDARSAQEVPEIRERLREIHSSAELEIRGDEIQLKFPRSAEDNDKYNDLSVFHIDASASASQLQRRACEINAIDELLEALAPLTIGAAEIEMISSILRKSYEKLSIFEIDEYDSPLPFFVATEHGTNYDIRTMSLGEISIISIYWQLCHAAPGSIVLLEEPETFLSPASQGNLLDYLATICVQKGLTIVLTTHSPQMLCRLQEHQVRFVYRSLAGAAVASQSAYDQMRQSVGIAPNIDRLLLVEDRAAREFASGILKKLDRSILRRSELIDVKGHGEITRILQAFPRSVRAFRAVGIYDGDMRGKISLDPPHTFLPGEKIEVTFRQQVAARPNAFAHRLGRTSEELFIILGEIAGTNEHDWFEQLGRKLAITYPELMSACIEEWIAQPENRKTAEEFVSALNAMIR